MTRSEQRLHGLDRLRDDRTEVLRGPVQGDLAQRDARDVQQVIDQVRELRGLPGDDVARPHDRIVARFPQPHDLDGHRDRRQRVAQLVGQHGQEFVLAAIDLPQRLGHARLRHQPPVLLLRAFSLGDHLGEHDDAADLVARVPPRPDLPAQPVGGSAGPHERVVVVDLHRARQATTVHLLPALRGLGEHLVVTAADQVLIAELVVGQPAGTVDEVAHVAVEHRDGCRDVLHEMPHLFLALLDQLLGTLAVGDVVADGLEFDDAAPLVEEPAFGPLHPAHLAPRTGHLVLGRRDGVLGRDGGQERLRDRALVRGQLPELLPDQLFGRALEVATIRGVDERVRAVGQEAADEIGLIFDHRAVLLLAATQARRRLRVLPYQRRQQHQRDGDEEEESLQRDDDLGDRADGERAATGSRAQQRHQHDDQQVQAQRAGAEANRRPQQERQRHDDQPLMRRVARLPGEEHRQRHDQARGQQHELRRPGAACDGSPPTHRPRRKGSAPRR